MHEPSAGALPRMPDSDVFCMLPWVSLHVATDGDVLPCAVADAGVPLGSTQSQMLQQIWNGPVMRGLRTDMLNGRRSSICNKCYEQEASGFASLRTIVNKDFEHCAPAVAATAEDGSLRRMEIAFLDVRFSNVCNFSCRTCQPRYSTGWYRYANREGTQGVIRPKASPAALLDELRPLLATVEQIYFAGGEPALTREHYELLDLLVEMDRTNVRLSYSTNFSVLHFRHWNLLELWKHFPHVNVGASLDGSGARGEYLRKGQRWERVIENRHRLAAQCPHVCFVVTPTLSILNCLHLPDFHIDWAAQGLIHPAAMYINILQTPPHFRLTGLPAALKDQVRARYESHIKFLSAESGCEAVIRGYASAIRFMDSQDTSPLLPDLRRVIAEQDGLRGESFAHTFPELGALLSDPGRSAHRLRGCTELNVLSETSE